MPKTCCRRQPSSGVTRRAASGGNLAPPTCRTSRLARSAVAAGAACSQSIASGGTSEVMVTFSASIRGKAFDGAGSVPSTTVPPAQRTPRMPGLLMGKLCATGSTTRKRVPGPRPQIFADSRTEYR